MGGASCVAFQMTLEQKEADMQKACLSISQQYMRLWPMKELWKVGDVSPWLITFSATYNVATLKTCLEKIMVLFR